MKAKKNLNNKALVSNWLSKEKEEMKDTLEQETQIIRITLYKCDSCSEIIQTFQKLKNNEQPITCPNPFCREKEHFAILTELK